MGSIAYNVDNLLRKKRTGGQEIPKIVEKTVHEMPTSKSHQAKMVEAAEKVDVLMREKYAKLTGDNKNFEQRGLYRQWLREKMVFAQLLDSETMSNLERSYKDEGRIDSLAQIRERQFACSDGEKKISKEAEEFEETAIMLMEYVENGLVSPKFFMRNLISHLDGEALRKTRNKIKEVPQENLLEDRKENLRLTIEKEAEKNKKRYSEFSEMIDDQRKAYVHEKRKIIQGDYSGLKTDRGLKDMIQRFEGDPNVSADMKYFAGNYMEMHKGSVNLVEMSAGKTIRQAELSGFQTPSYLHFNA